MQVKPDDSNRAMWRFLDGSASISGSMLAAVGINQCGGCAGLPLIGFLQELTEMPDGVIIVATLLLFPTTGALYGGFKMIFAAKEAVERKARERDEQSRQEGLQEGLQEGRQEERERISRALERHGVALTPELARILSGESE